MALTQVTGPYPIFTDLDGTPLDDGYLYIGAINQDPEQNPIQVFWDSNLTIPATQPIRTSNGYAYRNGTPALLYTGGEFSITIRNKREEFVLYSPVGYGFDPAAVSASVVKNDFIGNGVQLAFVLSASPSTILATNIFINGVYQEKDSYTLAGNTITFSIAPPLNSSIEVMTNETGVINAGNATAISYTASFAGATLQTVQTKLEQYVSVKDFGAVGDGVADDTAAIQAALDYVGANGGGTVFLPPTSATGRYRTTSVLRIPSYVTLEGTNPLVFPFDFNNGILADFADPMQWVIEAKTTSGGNYIPYNTILTSNLLGIGGTFNCGVRNLRIANVNTTPYGGVRMHASFGPIIENVAVAGVGCGFLANESLGGRWAVNARTLYYGMAVWNNANANEISLYTTQSPTATNVPAGYQLPFMTSLNGQLTTTYQLPSNTPYQYSTGLIIGADSGMTTQTSTICATIETFANSVLMLNTKSANFTNLYIEGSTNDVKYAVTAAKSTFNIMGCHAYMDGTGDLLAIGNETQSILNFNGIPFYASFGTVNTNQTKLIVYGLDNPTPSTPALNVQFASQNTPWIAPTFQNGWTNVGGVNATAAYRKNQYTGNVELKGFLSAGALNVAAFTLPVGYRPLEKRNFGPFGGYVAVQTDGEVQPDATNISLDGIFFKAEQ